MNGVRGKKKSLFIGRREPLLEDGNPLLYPRYIDVSEILIGPPAPVPNKREMVAAKQQAPVAMPVKTAAAAQAAQLPTSSAAGERDTGHGTDANIATAEQPRKNRKTSQQSATADTVPQPPADSKPEGAAGAEPTAEGAAPAKKPPKRMKKRDRERLAREAAAAAEGADAVMPEEPERPAKKAKTKAAKPPKKEFAEKISGPANAQEAQTMRQALGFVAPHATAAAPPAPGSFAFGFTPAADAEAADGTSDSRANQDVATTASGDEVLTTAAAGAPAAASGVPPDAAAEDVGAGNEGVMSAAERATQERLRRVMGSALAPDSPIPRRVFVGGMPFGYEEADIQEYWNYCGEIESLDMMRFPDTGRFKGIVFITFTTQEGYEAALECDGTELDGKRLSVEKCKSAGPKGKAARKALTGAARHSAPAAKVLGYHVAYVGNISFEADDKALGELFQGCNVTRVRLHTDQHTGAPKGYAHVHFRDEESLDRAIQLDGSDLFGRPIKVSYAQPKKMYLQK